MLGHPLAATIEAQESHWGVTMSFVPRWKSTPELYELLYDDADLDAHGKEFRIGVARGRDLGGDWSVTFVRNWFSSDQVFDDTFEQTVFLPPDFMTSETVTEGSIFTIPGDIEVLGVKYERFTPFVTIRDRVQIGITYGAGIGSLSGTVIEQRFEAFDLTRESRLSHLPRRSSKETSKSSMPLTSCRSAASRQLWPLCLHQD